ncbi:MAG TPA: hypothetical protein DCX19_01500 [Alphaproteobacteria bacterium]|nr:hypothetical protein [Alphaproteobacteria bacterium]
MFLRNGKRISESPPFCRVLLHSPPFSVLRLFPDFTVRHKIARSGAASSGESARKKRGLSKSDSPKKRKQGEKRLNENVEHCAPTVRTGNRDLL